MLKKTFPLLTTLFLFGCASDLRPGTSPMDVRDDYFNGPVTALGEDCESVRMALGAAWDDALACRELSGYLLPWVINPKEAHNLPVAAEAKVKRGTRLYELLKCVDDGIQSVRLARDSRDEPALEQEIAFWRNELALAATQVLAYADDVATSKHHLQTRLNEEAAKRGVSARFVEPKPWANPRREAWRKAGPMVGIRLPLDPPADHPAAWWNKTLGVGPMYIAAKFRDAGDAFFYSEQPLGAWGLNCTGPGQYDFSRLTNFVAGLKERNGKYLLELPTLAGRLTPEQQAEQHKENINRRWWIWTSYAPSLPEHLADNAMASMMAIHADGAFVCGGQVQLFDGVTARAYGDYLQAMSDELRRRGLYDTIAAIHLERSDWASLDETVDYSTEAASRWQAFMEERYGDIATLNEAAGTEYESFHELPIPVRDVVPAAKEDWRAWQHRRWIDWLRAKFGEVNKFNEAVGGGIDVATWDDVTDLPAVSDDGRRHLEFPLGGLEKIWGEYCKTALYNYDGNALNSWGRFLMEKYKSPASIRAALGDTFQEGYGWRLPLDYPPVIKIDYLHFRRAYVREYLAIKRELVQATFPDKLIIAEMRQMGDHDGIAAVSERIWGGFLGESDDIGQFSGVGPKNETLPFMIRSAEPPGFGSRLSDAIESLYRDYLWINFTDPGNLARYFYIWVCHGYMDYQLGWHDIHNHWMTNRLVYAIGPTVAATAPKPQRIGLMLPRSTFDLHSGAIYDETLGWDWLLGASKLAYTRVDERLIREGWLPTSGLEVLILPAAEAMDETVAKAIEEWVAAGGTLICSTMPGRVDTYGQTWTKFQISGCLAYRNPEPLLQKVHSAYLAVPLDATTSETLRQSLATEPETVSEAVKDTPLTVTIPRGIFTGGWAKSTDRKPAFQVLIPRGDIAKVLATYEGGRPAITINEHGKGRAVLMGYPLGVETVVADRTSIGFYRTYTFFVREPQVVARTAWLRSFLCDQLGYKPEFGVEFAEVERFKGKEAGALGLGVPKGFSTTDGDFLYMRTVGDPRGEAHEIQTERETPDLALRFFPRWRPDADGGKTGGGDTQYVGISTREVHYIAPRGAVNMYLSKHTYRCRINNPNIQAMWDVARNVPVGFTKDETGVTFDVSLPSGHIMMLAYSETPQIDLIAPAKFPGREKSDVLARCRALAGGTPVNGVTILTADEIKPWLESLNGPIPPAPGTKVDPDKPAPKQTVTISYGQPENHAAADTLAAFLREKFELDAVAVEQSSVCEITNEGTGQHVTNFATPVIFIGTEWTNNDLAIHGAFWNWPAMYGPHLPFTSTYAWPGEGRAVVSLSRRYALLDEKGDIILVNGAFSADVFDIRKVEDRWPLVRRKLHIAANGDDAQAAVEALIERLTK